MISEMTPTLTRAMTVFLLSLLVSSTVIFATSYYENSLLQERDNIKRNTQLWKSKIYSSVKSNQIVDAVETNFLNLVSEGIVGDENRLKWFENIQATAKNRNMPRIRFSISSQELLKKSKHQQIKNIDIYKSLMTLDIKMAHEGDLFSILNNLKKASGLYAVELCNIEKFESLSYSNKQMKSYCELAWYSLKNKSR